MNPGSYRLTGSSGWLADWSTASSLGLGLGVGFLMGAALAAALVMLRMRDHRYRAAAIQSANEAMHKMLQAKIDAGVQVPEVKAKTVTDFDLAKAYIDTLPTAGPVAEFFGGDPSSVCTGKEIIMYKKRRICNNSVRIINIM